jgi:saccharopine dehydrogenase-like NADP-dependent oxidoreductase
VGGYGHVGTALARELAVRYPGQLIIAGRHRDQAEALAATLPGGADAALVDVYDEESIHQATQHAKLLVNTAIDQRSPALLQAACERHAAYLDIGASPSTIIDMLNLSAQAVQHGTCVLVAAGLDPGCTNLMATRASAYAGGAHRIHVALLLSLGDTFGSAAIDFMLEALASPIRDEYQGRRQEFSAYRESRHCEFLPPFGRKLACRFPFPEQAFFTETFQTRHAANWYAMDNTAINRLLAALVRLGLTRLFRKESIRAVTRLFFQRLSQLLGGKDDVYALAEAQGPDGTWRVSLTGHQESKTTALCACPWLRYYTRRSSIGQEYGCQSRSSILLAIYLH